MTAARPLSIIGSPAFRDASIVFAAMDAGGELEVYISPLFWEGLQSETPDPCTTEDRIDFAVQAVEMLASQREPGVRSDGRRVVFVG